MQGLEFQARRVRRRAFVLIAVEARVRDSSRVRRRESLYQRRAHVLTELEHEAGLSTISPALRQRIVEVLDAYERALSGREAQVIAHAELAYREALSELARAVRRPASERGLAERFGPPSPREA